MSAMIENLTWADLIGSIGTLIVVAAYFATQMRYVNSDDIAFPLANLGGSVLIAYSLIFSFNLPSALMEMFWIAISILGIFQALRAKDAPKRPQPE